jgi:hypothetical protein
MGGDPPGGFLGKVPPPDFHPLDAPKKVVALPEAMADRIVAERMAPTGPAADFSRNLAVVQVEIKDSKAGTVRYEQLSAWNLEKQHAEPLVIKKVEDLRANPANRGKTVTITHLYTERIPCSGGQSDCQWIIDQKKTEGLRGKTYYSVKEYDGHIAKKLESHYGPYRRYLLPPPKGGGGVGGGGPGGVDPGGGAGSGAKKAGSKQKPPRPKPTGPPRRAPKAAAGAVAVALGGGDPQAAEAANARMTDRTAQVDKATSGAQQMGDAPDLGRGTANKGTASRSIPAPTAHPEPKILKSPPHATPTPPEPKILKTPPHPTPAPTAPPKVVVPEKGEHGTGRVTLSYDFSGGSKSDSIRMKSVDMSDFFKKESRVTRLIKSPALRKLAAAAAPTVVSLITGWGLNKIKEYFIGFIHEAETNFDKAFPTADERGDEFDYEDQKATYDVVVEQIGQPTPVGALKLSPKDIVNLVHGMFEFEKANLDLQEALAKDLNGDLPDIYDDIGRREEILSRIANNLEDTFVWIHSHVFGGIPTIYYASFDIWMVRDIFHEVSNEMSGLHYHIYQRQADYKKMLDKLVDDLEAAQPWLNYYRSFYEKNKNL